MDLTDLARDNTTLLVINWRYESSPIGAWNCNFLPLKENMIIGMLYANSNNDKVISLNKVFKAFSETNVRKLCLIEVIYSIKRVALWFVGSKNHGPDSRWESNIPHEQFETDRMTDIVAYRGAVKMDLLGFIVS